MTATARPIPHGTLSGRKYHRCTCDDCCTAAETYERNRRRNRAYGRWEPLTDAEPARQHVRRLMAAGVGWQRISDLAGVGHSVVQRLLYVSSGRPISRRIRTEHAAALLAVTASPTLRAPAALQDGTGTRRRIQALVAAGWTQRHLAARLNMHERHISSLTRASKVQRHTADAIAKIYTSLVGLNPLDHGVTPHEQRTSVGRAQRLGWQPASVWDKDIDDPAADPRVPDSKAVDDEAVQRVIDGATVALNRPERITTARILHAEQGLSLVDTAQRLGLNPRTILRWKSDDWPVSA